MVAFSCTIFSMHSHLVFRIFRLLFEFYMFARDEEVIWKRNNHSVNVKGCKCAEINTDTGNLKYLFIFFFWLFVRIFPLKPFLNCQTKNCGEKMKKSGQKINKPKNKHQTRYATMVCISNSFEPFIFILNKYSYGKILLLHFFFQHIQSIIGREIID